MFDRFDNRVALSGTLTTVTAIRIGAGKSAGVTGTDLPVVRDAAGKPYIPGSSFKGALRAHAESIMRALKGGDGACDPLNAPCIPAELMQQWQEQRRGDNEPQADERLADKVHGKVCDVCLVFGSNWMASKVSLRDLPLKGKWYGQYQLRNGVAIDRDTGTASDAKLYDFEVVPASTEFSCEVVVENASDWELGLLMLGLRPYERGEGTLGGARSRGLGQVRIEWQSRTRVSSDSLFEYISGQDADAFGDEEVKGWVKSLRARLKEGADA